MNAGERAAVQARKNSVLAAVGRKRRLAVTLSAGWAGRELASCSSLGWPGHTRHSQLSSRVRASVVRIRCEGHSVTSADSH